MKTKRNKSKKPKKTKKVKKPKKAKDPNVESEDWQEITYWCPLNKEWVTERVKVKKYKSLAQTAKDNKPITVIPDPLSDLEDNDDGLSIYGEEIIEE